ncbi:MAG: LysR family transcriptional regulator [Asticcacaulis sp.]|nr:LysR family transcriptional regulator [Asticcacaulis sp.]
MDRPAVDFSDVQAFFLVADTGSVVRAAERLGTSKSKVSRQVSRLEEALNARLLTRNVRGAQLTDAGHLYYQRAKAAMCALEAAGEAVAASVSEIAGPIRLSGPLSFGITHLAEALSEFAASHPRIDFDISFSDKRVDLVREGFDIAIRIGKLEDSSLIGRRLGQVHAVTVAAPDYLARKGRPHTPDDLARHDGLYYANASPTAVWSYVIDGRERSIKVPMRLRADNGEMLLSAAISGLGVARLPAFIAAGAIQSGKLEALLTSFNRGHSDLTAVMPPALAGTARIRALVDFLALKFRSEVL